MLMAFLWVQLVLGLSSIIASNATQLPNPDVEQETGRPQTLICPPGFFLLGRSCYAIKEEDGKVLLRN
ncbi:unnamed protein product [Cyprideis torosa]|uniref:Uncharacterized protein n=1 Tax=Cyprideis torosa TaxID=163714 RepID=A0A7R8WC65_9CRUS|nr:unnamed protein product [Cyprideis torosa]CAG0893092.1 unnamed protein product [Cyprideis torosa]